MSRLSVFVVAILTFLVGATAVDIEILEPIRTSGDDVALIFTSGGGMNGENYRKIAEAIQAASELRVWVALTGDQFQSTTGGYAISREIEGAIKELKRAGMTSDIYIAVAHGMGAHFLQPYGEKKTELKAIIQLGACLPRDTQPVDYPLPVLTLAAELDGVTRITRVAQEFGKLKQDMENSPLTLYRAPIIFLAGTNHGQFASGSKPPRITNNDLEPETSEADAHKLIGKHVDSFLTASFSTSPAKVEIALRELEEAYSEAREKFEPFVEVKALELSGNFSRWTVMIQSHIADDFADRIQINNQVGRDLWFYSSKPTILNQGDLVTIQTNTLVHYGLSNPGIYSMRESPLEIDMKLKSIEAISEALSDRDDQSSVDKPGLSLKRAPTTCKSLNQLALDVALNFSSPEAVARYKTRGRPIVIEDDYETSTSLFWSITPFKWWENKAGFHVKAISFASSLKSMWDPGMLYCKLMTPFRAMEWINFDSLQTPPTLG